MESEQLLIAFKYVDESTHPTVEFTCVSSTPAIYSTSEIIPASNDVPLVKFPYSKTYRVTTSDMKAKTSYQMMKINLAQQSLHHELIAERNKFLKNEHQRKRKEDQLRNASAIKIQAVYRGHRVRQFRSTDSQSRRSLRRTHILRRDIQEELRRLASNLRMRPIPGLNLDAVPRRSKNKENIAVAAAIQLQCFIRAAFAKKIYRVRAHIVQQKREKSACVRIVRFFRSVRRRKEMAMRRREDESRAVVKIQSWVRGMLGRMRYFSLV